MPRPSPRVRLTSPTPHTPPPSSLGNSLSPSPQGSPSRKGPVESTFQRSFRGICRNFEVINRNWNLLQSQGYECLKKLEKETEAVKKAFTTLSASNASPDARKRFKKSTSVLEESHIQLFGVSDKMSRQYELLRIMKGHLEELLQEMTRRKGLEAAHQEPLFTTWSLATFVEAFMEIVQLFAVCYHTSRTILSQVEMEEVSMVDLQAAWLSVRTAKNLSLLEFLDICQVELYEPEDEED